MNDDRALLEAFVVENRDLDKLEALLAEFNVFEALGAVRQELRHSDFSSFLLDPAQNHGLGDVFLKRFLKRVLADASDSPISPIEIDVADLRSAVVRREWRQIDILIHDQENGLVVAVENKVFSGEHSDQLRRYRDTISHEFPDYRAVFIFLTPEGDQPSDEFYLPFDYSSMADLIDGVRQAHASTLGSDVGNLMAHYTAMLRRYIVSDSEIVRLCQGIYRRHKQALDLIYEHRPDLQSELSDLLQTLVRESAEEHGLTLDHCSKSYVKFAVADWDKHPIQRAGQGWTRSGRVLQFEFQNYPDQLSLRFIIGPGPASLRRLVHNKALDQPNLFRTARKRLHTKWSTIYTKFFIPKRDYQDLDLEEMIEGTRTHWDRFLSQDLPRIREVIDGMGWPQAPESTTGDS